MVGVFPIGFLILPAQNIHGHKFSLSQLSLWGAEWWNDCGPFFTGCLWCNGPQATCVSVGKEQCWWWLRGGLFPSCTVLFLDAAHAQPAMPNSSKKKETSFSCRNEVRNMFVKKKKKQNKNKPTHQALKKQTKNVQKNPQKTKPNLKTEQRSF